MRVTFVYKGFESLSIECLSAVLKNAGHRVCLSYDPGLFDTFHFLDSRLKSVFTYFETLVDEIVESNPDIVAFSVVSDDYGWARKVAQAVKSRMQVPIVFGGIHPTCLPEKVIMEPFVDYVCVGEGEEALLELCDALQFGKRTDAIQNIWTKNDGKIIRTPLRPLISNLDALPLNDKDLFYGTYRGFVDSIYYIMTGRGCPYNCSYCYSGYIKKIYAGKGLFLRRRSVESVLDELRIAKNKYHMKRILFVDDVFTIDMKWLRAFLERYRREINLPFGCLLFPDLGDRKRELVSLLESSGCVAVGMGVQSVCRQQRDKILLRPGTNEEIEDIIREFKKTKIFLYADMILGIPLQTQEELIEAAYFLNKNNPDAVATLWLRYYPKSAIGDIGVANHAITKEELRLCEESLVYNPISRSGSVFDNDLARLGVLLLLAPVLPRKLLAAIINKRVYKYFPAKNMHYLSTILNGLCKTVWRGKSFTLYFSFTGRIKYYLYFMVRIITSRSVRCGLVSKRH